MSSMLVKTNMMTMSLLQAHISEHVSFQAREEVMQEMAPQLQQAASFHRPTTTSNAN